MKLPLYKDHPEAKSAEEAADRLIGRFMQDFRDWQVQYQNAGARDTATIEEFSAHVVRQLGVVRIF